MINYSRKKIYEPLYKSTNDLVCALKEPFNMLLFSLIHRCYSYFVPVTDIDALIITPFWCGTTGWLETKYYDPKAFYILVDSNTPNKQKEIKEAFEIFDILKSYFSFDEVSLFVVEYNKEQCYDFLKKYGEYTNLRYNENKIDKNDYPIFLIYEHSDKKPQSKNMEEFEKYLFEIRGETWSTPGKENYNVPHERSGYRDNIFPGEINFSCINKHMIVISEFKQDNDKRMEFQETVYMKLKELFKNNRDIPIYNILVKYSKNGDARIIKKIEGLNNDYTEIKNFLERSMNV